MSSLNLPMFRRPIISLTGHYLAPYTRQVILLSLMLGIGIVLQLVNPQIIRSFIDATQAREQSSILNAALLFIGMSLLQRTLMIASVYLSERIGWQTTNALRVDLTRHCLSLDMGFHKRITPGELIERIDGDVSMLTNLFSQLGLRVLSNLVLIIGILVLLFREDWRVGTGLTLYTIITFVILLAVQRIAVGRWMAVRADSAAQSGFIEERLAGTEDIRAAGAETHTLKQLTQISNRLLHSSQRAEIATNLSFVITNVLFVIGYALGLGIGVGLYQAGEVSIGSAFLIVYYIGMISGPLEVIRDQTDDLQQAGASVTRIATLLASRALVQEQARASLPQGALDISLEQVSFRYNDLDLNQAPSAPGNEQREVAVEQPTTLDKVSFRLGAGQVLGLLGRTGSGKTTISRLLLRLYDPDAGSIQIGGVELRDLSFAELRAHVGMVTQDVQLFQASVRDNLSLFNPAIDDTQIQHALQELGLWQWASGLPQGLETRLGSDGIGLSAGDAQLLAFARLLLRNPGLIILDEASSRLDPATERLLDRALDRLLQGRTAVIIAHRLATVMRADQIVILEQGQVVEQGARTSLANDAGSRFARLLRVGAGEELG